MIFGEIRAGSRRLSDPELKRELERAFHAYLALDDQRPADRSPS